MNQKSTSLLLKTIEQMSQIKPNELNAAIASFVMVFILMASYFILRPVRDAMASDWTDTEVSILWNLQFFISAAVVSVYGFAISRIRFKFIVPVVYSFFAASFVAFYFIVPQLTDPVIAEKSFYVWISAFSLFHLSVFWSFMADIFSSNQSKRLFSVVGAGASLGAIAGPAIPALFSEQLGQENLMLIAAACLICVVPISLYIYRLKITELHNQDIKADLSAVALGGAWWTGFRLVVSSPKLLGISAFILLYVFIGSFVYFEQKNLLEEYTRAERTQILGSIDWIINTLTFLMAFFVTGRIVKSLGMAFSLAMVPVLLVFGMLILAFAPLVIVVLGIQIVRRAGTYSVTRPAREMLFTHVTKEERFKAKPVIDIVVYRGGDAASGSLFALLTEGIGLGLIAVSLVGAGIATIWSVVATYLGRGYQREEELESNKSQSIESVARKESRFSQAGGTRLKSLAR
ncbi:NTP/NDP exchange transporter [Aliikangiella sp. IMCC44653]